MTTENTEENGILLPKGSGEQMRRITPVSEMNFSELSQFQTNDRDIARVADQRKNHLVNKAEEQGLFGAIDRQAREILANSKTLQEAADSLGRSSYDILSETRDMTPQELRGLPEAEMKNIQEAWRLQAKSDEAAKKGDRDEIERVRAEREDFEKTLLRKLGTAAYKGDLLGSKLPEHEKDRPGRSYKEIKPVLETGDLNSDEFSEATRGRNDLIRFYAKHGAIDPNDIKTRIKETLKESDSGSVRTRLRELQDRLEAKAAEHPAYKDRGLVADMVGGYVEVGEMIARGDQIPLVVEAAGRKLVLGVDARDLRDSFTREPRGVGSSERESNMLDQARAIGEEIARPFREGRATAEALDPDVLAQAVARGQAIAYQETMLYGAEKEYEEWLDNEELNKTPMSVVVGQPHPEYWKRFSDEKQKELNIRREIHNLATAKRNVVFDLESYSKLQETGSVQTREVRFLCENMAGFEDALKAYADIFKNSNQDRNKILREFSQVDGHDRAGNPVIRTTERLIQIREIQTEADAAAFRSKARLRIAEKFANNFLARAEAGRLEGVDPQNLRLVLDKLRNEQSRQITATGNAALPHIDLRGLEGEQAQLEYRRVWGKTVEEGQVLEQAYQLFASQAREAEQAAFNLLYGTNAFESWVYDWSQDGKLDVKSQKALYQGRFINAGVLDAMYPLVAAINKAKSGQKHGKHGGWIEFQIARLKKSSGIEYDEIQVVDSNSEREARRTFWTVAKENRGGRSISVLRVPEVYPREMINSPWERNRAQGKTFTQWLLDTDNKIPWGRFEASEEQDEFTGAYARLVGKAATILNYSLQVPQSPPGDPWQSKARAAFDKLPDMYTLDRLRYIHYKNIFPRDQLPYLEGEFITKSPQALGAYSDSRRTNTGFFKEEKEFFFPWDSEKTKKG